MEGVGDVEEDAGLGDARPSTKRRRGTAWASTGPLFGPRSDTLEGAGGVFGVQIGGLGFRFEGDAEEAAVRSVSRCTYSVRNQAGRDLHAALG